MDLKHIGYSSLNFWVVDSIHIHDSKHQYMYRIEITRREFDSFEYSSGGNFSGGERPIRLKIHSRF